MLRVALTGGIGSGKSSAAEIFAALGAVVVDSDEIARKVLDRESVGFGEVVAVDRKSTRLNSSHVSESRMPSSA